MPNRALQGFRYVQVQHGDTLQKLAARELDDASKWVDIVNINNLVYPYLTGDPEAAGPRVILYGRTLAVPATTAQAQADTSPDQVFGRDLSLEGGMLSAVNGDFALVAGRANLKQAYKNRIDTPLGELLWHLLYGCGVHRLKGRRGGPVPNTLAAKYVRDALSDDERTDQVLSTTAVIEGGRISVSCNVQPISGATIDISGAV